MKMLSRIGLAMMLALGLLLLTACNQEPVPLTLDQEEMELMPGETAVLTVQGAKPGEVTWGSNNISVASVDGMGNIAALSPGTAVISVTAGKVSATCTVVVTSEPAVNVDSLAITPSNLVLDPGEVQQLHLTPVTENEAVVWRSEDSSIAKVDQSGKVTAEASGSTQVSATVAGKRVECTILVATDISKHRALSVTGVISRARQFSPDYSMLISYIPPFGGGNSNGAVLVDIHGEEYSLPWAPCVDLYWYGQASWRGGKFVYSVVDDDYWGEKSAIYIYSIEDHSAINITQDFDWERYKDYYIDDFAPAFTAEDTISVVFPDGLWEHHLGSKVWTQVQVLQRGEGPFGSYPTYWSPDYSKVAWLEKGEDENKLTVHDIGAASQKSLPLPQYIADLYWSPDSAKLAWVEGNHMGDEENLVVFDVASGVESVVHQTKGIADFSWSEDSKTLAVAEHHWDRDQGMIWFPITVVSTDGDELEVFPDPGNSWDGSYVGTNLSWVPGQNMLSYNTYDGLVILRTTDGKRWLIRPPLPSKEMQAHDLYELEEQGGFPMGYTWLENGNLTLSIHFGGRFPYGTMEIYDPQFLSALY